MYHLFYKVKTADIAAIKFLLEGYENIFSVATVDESIPKIQISITDDFLEDAHNIIDDLKTNHFYMEQILDNPRKSQGNF